MPSWNVLGDLQESIRSLFGNWRTLAGFGHELAEAGLFVALAARQAVLNGDDETVEAFAQHWLGIKRLTKVALDAVKSALLDDSWLEKAADMVTKTIRRLYKRVYRPPIGQFGKHNWQGRESGYSAMVWSSTVTWFRLPNPAQGGGRFPIPAP